LEPGQEWVGTAGVWHFVQAGSGAVYWLGGNQCRPLAAGEMLVMTPAAEGLVRASQIGRVVLHAFSFAPDVLCGFFSVLERHLLDTGEANGFQKVRCLPSTHPVTCKFTTLANSSLRPDSLAQRVEVLSLVAALFDEEIARHRSPASPGTSAPDRFTQLVARMPDTELIHYSPGQLARLCGCSVRHFNRLFREYFGTSTRTRQTELRLLKARQLLCASDQQINQIAAESGYRNLSLFNSLFKRRFGATPSEWRRKATAGDSDTRT
jgi:AraC-like DNA-binding protein